MYSCMTAAALASISVSVRTERNVVVNSFLERRPRALGSGRQRAISMPNHKTGEFLENRQRRAWRGPFGVREIPCRPN